jgi:hypothetical protein
MYFRPPMERQWQQAEAPHAGGSALMASLQEEPRLEHSPADLMKQKLAVTRTGKPGHSSNIHFVVLLLLETFFLNNSTRKNVKLNAGEKSLLVILRISKLIFV